MLTLADVFIRSCSWRGSISVTLGTKQAQVQSSIIFKGKPARPLLGVFREYLHLFTDDLISISCGGLMILANARHY